MAHTYAFETPSPSPWDDWDTSFNDIVEQFDDDDFDIEFEEIELDEEF